MPHGPALGVHLARQASATFGRGFTRAILPEACRLCCNLLSSGLGVCGGEKEFRPLSRAAQRDCIRPQAHALSSGSPSCGPRQDLGRTGAATQPWRSGARAVPTRAARLGRTRPPWGVGPSVAPWPQRRQRQRGSALVGERRTVRRGYKGARPALPRPRLLAVRRQGLWPRTWWGASRSSLCRD